MKQVHFVNNTSITVKDQQLLKAAKTAKTKTDNTISQIKKAIEELHQENIKPSQVNVIKRLNGKKCMRTIKSHWQAALAPKHLSEFKVLIPEKEEDETYKAPAQQKPLYRYSDEELGVPSLSQERKLNPGKSDAVLMYYILAMRDLRIKELQRTFTL